MENYIEILTKNGLSLRDHQIDGIRKLLAWHAADHGGILADEMGLGKTCQAVAIIWILMERERKKNLGQNNGKYLVICPLSVIDHWEQELARFGCGMIKTMKYVGNKDERIILLKEFIKNGVDVLLTTYQFFMNDSSEVNFHCSAMVLDEAHRAKSSSSLLHQMLRQHDIAWTLLMTGTPVQNNLHELYSLLNLVHPLKFPLESVDKFVEKYRNTGDTNVSSEIRAMLNEYLLRRTKANVCMEIPHSSEVILYHGITEQQKQLYRAILCKNYQFFDETLSTNRQSLMNVMMQLRKCVVHPYLFEGQEPEPFEEGEHLVTASGKLHLLDHLLRHLKKKGHRVLLFSQMTRALDILQDYLAFRGYSYERLDGNIRAEERFAAVSKFQKADSSTFVFLLSTRAGGVGLNLTGADTVIFLDSDFNPQNDLQAAARCHRIGQTRPVKIIRLIARHTVEQIIQFRASGKLRLTSHVIGDSNESEESSKLNSAEINAMILSGLSKMNDGKMDEEDNRNYGNDGEKYFTEILGSTDADSQWHLNGEAKTDTTNGITAVDEQEPIGLYVFEGKDYKSATVDEADRKALTEMLEQARLSKENEEEEPSRRRVRDYSTFMVLGEDLVTTKRKPLSAEQLTERTRKRAETIAENQKRELEQADERKRKLQEKWKRAGYISTALPDGRDEDFENISMDQQVSGPFFLLGDVTKPQIPNIQADTRRPRCLILHCVDNSGSFGRGGVFTALEKKSPKIREAYETAGEMRDLRLGDAHLIELDSDNDSGGTIDEPSTSSTSTQSSTSPRLSCILLVAQDQKHRDVIRPETLANCLRRVSVYARSLMETVGQAETIGVHLPRIGYGIRNVQWYSLERLIRKYLSGYGIPTYIYYFNRRNRPMDTQKRFADDTSNRDDDASGNSEPPPMKQSRAFELHPVFQGLTIALVGIDDSELCEKYRNLIRSHDGDTVEDSMDLAKATHAALITGEEGVDQKIMELRSLGLPAVVPIVNLEWIEESIKKKQLADFKRVNETSQDYSL